LETSIIYENETHVLLNRLSGAELDWNRCIRSHAFFTNDVATRDGAASTAIRAEQRHDGHASVFQRSLPPFPQQSNVHLCRLVWIPVLLSVSLLRVLSVRLLWIQRLRIWLRQCQHRCRGAAPACSCRVLSWCHRWDHGASNATSNSRLRTRPQYACVRPDRSAASDNDRSRLIQFLSLRRIRYYLAVFSVIDFDHEQSRSAPPSGTSAFA